VAVFILGDPNRSDPDSGLSPDSGDEEEAGRLHPGPAGPAGQHDQGQGQVSRTYPDDAVQVNPRF
jgi:hypothetical protein